MEKKEAMKILKDFHDKSALFSVRTALDTIIPELRESEDEKIREELIKHLRDGAEGYMPAGDSKDYTRWLSWLEKQSYTKKDVDDAYLKGICNTKHELEKQGEQKSIWHNEYEEPQRDSLILLIMQSGTPIVAKIIEPNHTFNHGERWAYIDDLLEKQSEQKSVDKIEPKFHEGEWIISNDKKSTYQVIEVKRGIYVIRDNVDNHEYHIGIEECEKSGRIFTIQDAKDGDVLYSLDTYQPFIYKARNIHEHATAYCGINKYGKFFVWNTNDCIITLDKYIPATKEQRDTLLKAMADAGYTFDFGKKELKKIEKKSQRMVSAEAKEALYDKPTDEEMKELLRTEYEKGRADTIAEMKSFWSEEDEKMLEGIVNTVKDIRCQSLLSEIEIYDDYIDWLKSLKDRVIPKPKHEWSIEDERTIAIINNALTESNTPPDDYDKVYEWLESIKQRIGWKPSNAQIEALEHFVRSIGESGYASPYDNNTKLLYSLLEQLKKLKA